MTYREVRFLPLSRMVHSRNQSVSEHHQPALSETHFLPNCQSVIIITWKRFQIPSAIFTESYLSFIGLSVSAPMPSLGSLANTARGGLQSYPLRLIFPGAYDLYHCSYIESYR